MLPTRRVRRLARPESQPGTTSHADRSDGRTGAVVTDVSGPGQEALLLNDAGTDRLVVGVETPRGHPNALGFNDPIIAVGASAQGSRPHPPIEGRVVISQKIVSTAANAGKPKANHHQNSW